jgi:hypothetical protein
MSKLLSSALVSLLVLSVVPAAGAADPCALVPQADVARLLGGAILAAHPSGPEIDEDSGGMQSVCAYQVKSAVVMLNWVEFATAAQALAPWQSSLTEAKDDADTKVSLDTVDPGSAFWATTQGGTAYTMVQGRHVIQAGAGGPGFQSVPAQSLRLVALEAARHLQH